MGKGLETDFQGNSGRLHSSPGLLSIREKLQVAPLMTLICAFFFYSNAYTQITANATLNPDRIETGDTFLLRILVSGTKVEPRQVDFSTWKSIPVAPVQVSQTRWSRSGAQWVQQFTLIAFDSAEMELPALTVYFHIGEPARTNTMHLTVMPTPGTADPTDIETIRDIQRTPDAWTDYWPWMAAAAALLVLIIWYMQRKKPKRIQVVLPLQPILPDIPAHEQALQKLRVLEEEKMWKKGDLKEYYAQLSLILREYLQQRYGILALESTTIEITAMLKATSFPKMFNKVLQELLTASDMVKYAQSQPADNLHQKALENTRSLVQQTV